MTIKLEEIRQQIEKGFVPPEETVRSFLAWFGVTMRGNRAVTRIRRLLENAGIETDPDFEVAFIDSPISFIHAGSRKASTSQHEIFQIGRLEPANRKPIWIAPDKPLCVAVTIMLTHDISQIPVMTSPHNIKGVISWKTIGWTFALKQKCEFARDCMEQPRIVQLEDSLFSVINYIAEFDYVLVQAPDKTICGIVTAADFSEQFHKLGEPYLLIGEIENSIRKLIHGKFTASELSDVRDPNDKHSKVGAISDLTFGDYVRLLQDNKRWKRVGLALDRAEFVKRLDEIREIRNDIMHFAPDGILEQDLKTLRDFSNFMNQLRILGAIG